MEAKKAMIIRKVPLTLLNFRVLIVVRNLISVKSVGKPFILAHNLVTIKRCI
jgi:hypothetical protein